MAATQAMTGSGGWPMSVFLMPDASPFYAETYFPPTSVSKRPGFKDLLTTIHKVWLKRREDVSESASRMVAALETGNVATPALIKPDVFEHCFSMLKQSYDPREVGMYDQLGGGFHRYSVDATWFVPHFEKMLYDQAQLANSYLDAYQITRDETYARLAKEIFVYLLRDMRDPAGGFYSAEDADSANPYSPGQHGEGAFYLWTKEEIVKRLGVQAADIFNASYGVRDDGNVAQDPMKEFSDRNILYLAQSNELTAKRFNGNMEHIEQSLAASRELLFNEQEQRRQPHLDDKVITAWNGMMISALARGSRILQDPQLLGAAKQTATFIKEHPYHRKDKTLLRRYRKSEAGLAGQLSDYTYLIAGLLDLYRASQDPQWLSWSVELTERQIELFWNEKEGFFFDSVADPSVKIRMRDKYDGAEPAGNSVAANNLLRLGQLGNRPQWKQMPRRLVESFSEVINGYPPALPLMLTAWQHIDTKPSQVVIAGKRGAEDTEALLNIVDINFSRSRLVLLADGAENQAYLAEKLPFLETVVRLEGKATAYVCSDFTCKTPVTEPKALQLQVNEPQSGI